MEPKGIQAKISAYVEKHPELRMATQDIVLFEMEKAGEITAAEIEKVKKGSVFGSLTGSIDVENAWTVEQEELHRKKVEQNTKAQELVNRKTAGNNVYKNTFDALKALGWNDRTKDAEKLVERLSDIEPEIYEGEEVGKKLVEILIKNKMPVNFESVADAMESLGITIRTEKEQEAAKNKIESITLKQFTQSLLSYMYSYASEMYADAENGLTPVDFGFYTNSVNKLFSKVTNKPLDFKSISKHFADWAKNFQNMSTLNESDFKKQFKDAFGVEYDEQLIKDNIQVLQDPSCKEFNEVCQKVFGFNVIKNSNKDLTITNVTTGLGDIAVMLGTLGAAGEMKAVKAANMAAVETATRLGGKVAAKGSTMFAQKMSKFAGRCIQLSGGALAGGVQLGGFELAKGTLGNVMTAQSLSDLGNKEIEVLEHSLSSFGFGFFGGIWGQTAVASVQKAVTRTSARVAGELAPKFAEGSVELSEVVSTFVQKSAPTVAAQATGFLTEVCGFTMYETAVEVLKTHPEFPDKMGVEDVANILWAQFKGQGMGLGQIRLVSSLIMFMTGGKVAQKASMDYLCKAVEFKGIKVREIKEENATKYVIEGDNFSFKCNSIEEAISSGIFFAQTAGKIAAETEQFAKTDVEDTGKEAYISPEAEVISTPEVRKEPSAYQKQVAEVNGLIDKMFDGIKDLDGPKHKIERFLDHESTQRELIERKMSILKDVVYDAIDDCKDLPFSLSETERGVMVKYLEEYVDYDGNGYIERASDKELIMDFMTRKNLYDRRTESYLFDEFGWSWEQTAEDAGLNYSRVDIVNMLRAVNPKNLKTLHMVMAKYNNKIFKLKETNPEEYKKALLKLFTFDYSRFDERLEKFKDLNESALAEFIFEDVAVFNFAASKIEERTLLQKDVGKLYNAAAFIAKMSDKDYKILETEYNNNPTFIENIFDCNERYEDTRYGFRSNETRTLFTDENIKTILHLDEPSKNMLNEILTKHKEFHCSGKEIIDSIKQYKTEADIQFLRGVLNNDTIYYESWMGDRKIGFESSQFTTIMKACTDPENRAFYKELISKQEIDENGRAFQMYDSEGICRILDKCKTAEDRALVKEILDMKIVSVITQSPESIRIINDEFNYMFDGLSNIKDRTIVNKVMELAQESPTEWIWVSTIIKNCAVPEKAELTEIMLKHKTKMYKSKIFSKKKRNTFFINEIAKILDMAKTTEEATFAMQIIKELPNDLPKTVLINGKGIEYKELMNLWTELTKKYKPKDAAIIMSNVSEYNLDIALNNKRNFSPSELNNILRWIRENGNNHQIAEKLLDDTNFSANDIAEILQFDFSDYETAKYAEELCSNYKKMEIEPRQIPILIGLKDTISYKKYQAVRRKIGIDKMNALSKDEAILACKFSDVYKVTNINEISTAGKKAFLRELVASNSGMFNVSEDFAKMFPLIPKSQKEYCSLLPSIVRSLGIETAPLTPEQRVQIFNQTMSNLAGSVAKISDTDFANLKITQEYSKEAFIKDVLAKVKDLKSGERQKVYDYFGFELHHNRNNETGYSITGYPVNLNNGKKLAQIIDTKTKAVVEALRPDVIRFSERNPIKCGNKQIEALLNEIVEALPEIRTTIGKIQHGTHDYDVFQHSLKVMQKITQDKGFAQLSESDKKIMLLASLMHDITKAEGVSDKTHAKEGSFDSFFIAKKFKLTKDEEIKLYTLIKSHEWLGYVNTAKSEVQLTKRLQSVAYDLQADNLFDMALMFAHADLKAVKTDDTFHDTTEGKSRARFDSENNRVFDDNSPAVRKSHGETADIYAERIRGYVKRLQYSKPLLPVTKIPAATRINQAITQVNSDGSTNIKGVYKDSDGLIVIKFNEVEDWEAIGFPKGSVSHGYTITGENGGDIDTGNIKFFVHGLDYSNQLAKFDAFSLVDSDALLSVSYAERPESKYRFFRPQGVLLDVPFEYVHGGGETDSGSGCGKSIKDFKKDYIFGGKREGDRKFVSKLIKETIGLNDEEYLQFIAENRDKPMTEVDPIEAQEQIIKAFAVMHSHNRYGNREYNEMYASNPTVMGVFAYNMDYKETVGNPLDFLGRNELGKHDRGFNGVAASSVAQRTSFLREYALERDLPFIIFGD